LTIRIPNSEDPHFGVLIGEQRIVVVR